MNRLGMKIKSKGFEDIGISVRPKYLKMSLNEVRYGSRSSEVVRRPWLLEAMEKQEIEKQEIEKIRRIN